MYETWMKLKSFVRSYNHLSSSDRCGSSRWQLSSVNVARLARMYTSLILNVKWNAWLKRTTLAGMRRQITKLRTVIPSDAGRALQKKIRAKTNSYVFHQNIDLYNRPLVGTKNEENFTEKEYRCTSYRNDDRLNVLTV